ALHALLARGELYPPARSAASFRNAGGSGLCGSCACARQSVLLLRGRAGTAAGGRRRPGAQRGRTLAGAAHRAPRSLQGTRGVHPRCPAGPELCAVLGARHAVAGAEGRFPAIVGGGGLIGKSDQNTLIESSNLINRESTLA